LVCLPGPVVSGERGATLVIDNKRLDVERDIKKIRQYFKRKPVSSYYQNRFDVSGFTDSQAESSKRLLEDNILRLRGFNPYKLPDNPTWGENPQGSRIWQREYNILGWTESLIKAYHHSGDARYFKKARHLILDWIRDNIPESQKNLTWHDEGSSKRLQVLLAFWEHHRKEPILDDVIFSRLMHAFKYHGDMLMKESFYSRHSNHGMFQAQALALLGSMIPELAGANAYLRTGMRRIKDEMDHALLEDHVHNEHSPGYHVLMLNILRELKRARELFGWPLDELERTIGDMEHALAHFVTPKLGIPLVGDSDATMKLLETKNVHPALRYVVTRGREGKQPKKTALFKKAGYAVLRNTSAIDEHFDNSFYIFFTAGFHNTNHKHQDDLSFVLHAHGEKWLIDPGFYSYNYGDRFCKYAYTARAHNTVLVDCKGWRKKPENFGKSGILSLTSRGSQHVIHARHEMYPGVSITRRLKYSEPDKLVVTDEVKSKKDHWYWQLWHLDPGKIPKIKGNRFIVCGEKTHAMVLTIEGADFIRTARGKTKPMLWGFAYPRRGKKVENTVLIAEKVGESATLKATISFVKKESVCSE
jgi:hypothetical protein